MSSSSPAHSSVSAATSVGGGGQGGSSSNAALVSDDNSSFHFPTDLISPQDRKEEALLGGFPHKKTEIAKRWNFSQPK
uniref:Uncharacterized protein n=1 Tax=Nelumbo nucifera TaxID=4432 RepID=A0A822YVP6_NELNU|nr:TPA_asm: hypothetical protein HUJ06_007231 [Nelumbo nucifera]